MYKIESMCAKYDLQLVSADPGRRTKLAERHEKVPLSVAVFMYLCVLLVLE
jgi:hypothetical protein